MPDALVPRCPDALMPRCPNTNTKNPNTNPPTADTAQDRRLAKHLVALYFETQESAAPQMDLELLTDVRPHPPKK